MSTRPNGGSRWQVARSYRARSAARSVDMGAG
jgi:hypothetical protein